MVVQMAEQMAARWVVVTADYSAVLTVFPSVEHWAEKTADARAVLWAEKWVALTVGSMVVLRAAHWAVLKADSKADCSVVNLDKPTAGCWALQTVVASAAVMVLQMAGCWVSSMAAQLAVLSAASKAARWAVTKEVRTADMTGYWTAVLKV